MSVMASWGDMKFEISDKALTPLSKFKTGFKIKNDNNNDTSGTPPTNTTGRDTETITFSVTYSVVDGSNVRRRFGAWRALIGQVNIFYLGGEPFGAGNFQLESADLSDCEIDNNGTMLYAVVNITLTEYVEQSKKEKTSASKTTSKKSRSTAKAGSSAKMMNTALEVVETKSKAEATEENKRSALSARPTSREKQKAWV